MSVDLTDIALIFGGVIIFLIILLFVAVNKAYNHGFQTGRLIGELNSKISSQAAIIAAQRRVGEREEWVERELDI